MPPPLLRLLIEPIVRMALAEDLGRAGDVTSAATVPEGTRAEAALVARRSGVIAGLDLARLAFETLDPDIGFSALVRDGDRVEAGSTLARVAGDGRAILGAERTALNLLCRLSGIASATRDLVDRVAGTKARVTCTRKTTPGLRAIEKYAVRCGGGANHRFGLDDAVLIKDNHVAIAGGVAAALAHARTSVGHLVKIEVEIDRLDQLDAALAGGADVILLDNMDPRSLAEAVRRIGGQAIAEASGGITPATIAEVAASGVDIISVGWLTHSAPILDIGLDIAA